MMTDRVRMSTVDHAMSSTVQGIHDSLFKDGK